MRGVDTSPAALRRTLVARGRWKEHSIHVAPEDMPKQRPVDEGDECVFKTSTQRKAEARRRATEAAKQPVREHSPAHTPQPSPTRAPLARLCRLLPQQASPLTPLTCPGCSAAGTLA